MSEPRPAPTAQFNLFDLLQSFPDHSDSLLLDRYLVDHGTASARLFRVYKPTPAHFHRLSDEHLYVLSGEGTVWLEDPKNVQTFAPGSFLVFPRNTAHATPELTRGPVVFLAIDTPRRHPEDIVFIDPGAGTPAEFIQPAP